LGAANRTLAVFSFPKNVYPIGHATPRLLRMRIGNFRLGDLPAGQWRILAAEERALVMKRGTGLRPVW
jgi:hypothetical protein